VNDRRKRIRENLFANMDKVSPQALDQSIFGGGGLFDNVIEDETISYLSLQQIHTDPIQPRRAIPSVIRRKWHGQAQDIAEMFDAWLYAVNDERKSDLDLDHYFAENADEEKITEAKPHSLEADFIAVVNLAVSIRRDGLTNPITVAPHKDGYIIETGERRWLAFHLLDQLFSDVDDDQWQHIPARIVDKPNVWRQANENNIRADLNAIDKARQFALLLMNLLEERGEKFLPVSQMPSGNHHLFYSQVADSTQYRIPRGKAQQIMNAMGLKNTRQLSYYRSLLRLSDEAWQLADDYNLPEHALRQCISDAQGDTQKLIEAIQDIIHDRRPAPLNKSNKEKKTAHPLSDYAIVVKNARKLNRYVTKTRRLSKREMDDALQKINEIRDWLQKTEAQLYQKSKK